MAGLFLDHSVIQTIIINHHLTAIDQPSLAIDFPGPTRPFPRTVSHMPRDVADETLANNSLTCVWVTSRACDEWGHQGSRSVEDPPAVKLVNRTGELNWSLTGYELGFNMVILTDY